MHTPSLGRRVVVAGTAAVALMALGLDALLYVSVRSTLQANLAAELAPVAAALVHEAEQRGTDALPAVLAQRGLRATVRGPGGEVEAVVGEPVGRSERVLSRRVEVPGGGSVEVVASLAETDRSLRQLLLLEAVATPLVVVLALLVLRLVAEFALRPLDRIAAAARRTTGGSRGERLRPDPADTRLGQMASAYDDMLDALERALADAEAAREESDLQLEHNRRILATAREAFLAVDEDDRIVDWNDEAQRTFGWCRQEVIGRTFAGTVTPPGSGEAAGPLREFVAPAEADPTEGSRRVVAFSAAHRDGHRFPARMVAWATRHHATSTINAFVWDVTEQLRAEETMSRLAALVESADEAMLSTDLRGTILTWNTGAEAMYGYGAAEAVGRHIDLIVPEDLRPALRSSLEAVARGEPVERSATVRRCRNGTLVEVAASMSPVRDAGGAVRAVSSIDRDVTEERWMARQLDSSLAALASAAEEARESEAATRRFLDDAAHQLRAPITNIQACAEVLLRAPEDLDPEERDDLLGAVVRETGRAGRLLAGLLRIARLNHGASLAPAPCDVVSLCEDLAANQRPRYPQLALTVTTAGREPIGRPPLDHHAVAEIVANLLDNACRHARTAVQVTLRAGDGALEIEVADDGSGLPDGRVDAAFERFVSLDGRGGSGLGLPIARELARAHGGEVSYLDKAFVVHLPTTEPTTHDGSVAPS